MQRTLEGGGRGERKRVTTMVIANPPLKYTITGRFVYIIWYILHTFFQEKYNVHAVLFQIQVHKVYRSTGVVLTYPPSASSDSSTITRSTMNYRNNAVINLSDIAFVII